jgi:hypothetical protein
MRTLLTLLGAALLSTGASAAGYVENRLGDLSDDGLAPTFVRLRLGPNTIDGNFGKAGTEVDRDYFTIKIAVGQKLKSIVLDPKTVIGGDTSFIGMQKGNQVTAPPVNSSPEDLLGWTHFGTSSEGTDILPAICQGAGAKGCTPPLGPGKYSFWVQELATCACHYRFIFTVVSAAED